MKEGVAMSRMRRFCLCILCLMLVLLCGCQEPDTSTQTTEGSEAHPLSQGLPMPKDPGNALVSYDPAREIYFFGCENVHARIYLENARDCALNFLVISKRQLNKDSIQVSAPVENAYTYIVADLVADSEIPFRETFYTALDEGQQLGEVSSDNWLPYYVYQGYAGVDFAKLGELWQIYLNEAQKRSEAGDYYASDAESAAYKEFVAFRDAALSEFKAVQADQTREFYIYQVSIVFGQENAVDEVLTELTVTIDGTQYMPFTGEIHLVPSRIPACYEERTNMSLFTILQTPATGLYGDGMGRLITHMFTAEDDLTLMECIIREEQFSVLDIIVTIRSKTGNSANFYWDGASPVDVRAGDSVTVEIIFHNADMDHFSYFQKVHPELVYSVGEQLYSETAEISCSSIFVMNYHELYAIIFDGVDMESYYRNYYYPIFEDWRTEYTK